MNKLEITDVMICEWDADTKCIIVSPADGWKVNVKSTLYPISEAHASLVTMEKMDGPYSGIDGKWLKWVGASDTFMTNGKWYKIDHVQEENAFFYNDVFDQDAVNLSEGRFKTSDPRDYNPEHRGYLIEENPNYHPSHPETKYIFHNTNNCDQPSGNAETVEICRELIDDIIDKADNPDEKPEPKPHQLKEYDAVECSPEERAEIIRIADECGVQVYNGTRTPKDSYPNLAWYNGEVSGLFSANNICFWGEWNLQTVPDFISKIRGTYRENEVNVSEHKHPEIV